MKKSRLVHNALAAPDRDYDKNRSVLNSYLFFSPPPLPLYGGKDAVSKSGGSDRIVRNTVTMRARRTAYNARTEIKTVVMYSKITVNYRGDFNAQLDETIIIIIIISHNNTTADVPSYFTASPR